MLAAGKVNAMQETTPLNDSLRERICFIGDVFGPLFLYEPSSDATRELYETLAAMDVRAAAEDWPFVSLDSAQPLLERIQGALGSSSEEDLLWEYRRLFVGPARKAAPPWGSVYLDKDQVIFGLSTLDLRQWMRENGIAKTTEDGDPEDHIGRMLLLMSWLSENEPEALPAFLQDHLLTWAPHFLQVVSRETEGDFFAALAQLCEASLEGMREELALTVPPVKFYR